MVVDPSKRFETVSAVVDFDDFPDALATMYLDDLDDLV